MGGMAKGRSAEALKEGPQPVCTLSEQHWEQDQAMEEEQMAQQPEAVPETNWPVMHQQGHGQKEPQGWKNLAHQTSQQEHPERKVKITLQMKHAGPETSEVRHVQQLNAKGEV